MRHPFYGLCESVTNVTCPRSQGDDTHVGNLILRAHMLVEAVSIRAKVCYGFMLGD